MHYTIQLLERKVRKLCALTYFDDRCKSQIAELEQAIAILKQHAAKVPVAPPEFLRDYPHASD